MSRKIAREGAMCLLFSMEINGEFNDKYISNFIYDFDFFNFTTMEKKYILDVCENIIKNKETIDKYISNNLKGWRINRIAKVELSVLRIAIYEIIFRDDIPIEVSVNEAIEIVKKYSTEESYKFINGVLGGAIKEIEEESGMV